MQLPVQAQPIKRNENGAAVIDGNGVILSAWWDPRDWGVDWSCAGNCAVAVAKCALSGNPAGCLIEAGMKDCVKCL